MSNGRLDIHIVLQFNEFPHCKRPSAHATLTEIYKDNLDDDFIFSRFIKLGTIETVDIREYSEEDIFLSINCKPYFFTKRYNVRCLGAQCAQN